MSPPRGAPTWLPRRWRRWGPPPPTRRRPLVGCQGGSAAPRHHKEGRRPGCQGVGANKWPSPLCPGAGRRHVPLPHPPLCPGGKQPYCTAVEEERRRIASNRSPRCQGGGGTASRCRQEGRCPGCPGGKKRYCATKEEGRHRVSAQRGAAKRGAVLVADEEEGQWRALCRPLRRILLTLAHRNKGRRAGASVQTRKRCLQAPPRERTRSPVGKPPRRPSRSGEREAVSNKAVLACGAVFTVEH